MIMINVPVHIWKNRFKITFCKLLCLRVSVGPTHNETVGVVVVFQQFPATMIISIYLKYPLLLLSVPDPKLIISDLDPDPQIENQEFRIRIPRSGSWIRILLWTSDGEKKWSILVNNKTQMGRNF